MSIFIFSQYFVQWILPGVIPHCLYRDSLTLTLLVPIPDEEKKLGQIFILTFLCDASKGFYEGLKGIHKTFLRPS